MYLSRLKPHWQIAGILTLALAVRVWGISFGLPGIDHGDEAEVINHAVRFGSGDLNPHRFQYGALVQYALFCLYGSYYLAGLVCGFWSSVHEFALVFVRDPSMFYLLGRFFSAFLGTATVFLCFLLGRRLGGKNTGLLAAGLLAVCMEHVAHSHYATVDTGLAFFFTLALYRCLVVYDRGSWADYCLAGLCTGLAFAVKFNGVFAALPLTLAHLFRSQESLGKKICSGRLAAAYACILAGLGLANPFFYVELKLVLREVGQLNAMHTGSSFMLSEYLRIFPTDEFWGAFVGWIGIAGFCIGLVRSRRHCLLAATAAAVVLFASRYRYAEGKYILHSLPVLAVLAASLLTTVVRTKRGWPLAVLGIALAVHPLGTIAGWDRFYAGESINLQAKRWIEQNIPAGTKILLDNSGNDGPKLDNDPANIQRQYERAAAHGSMKAEYLKLQAELRPPIYYNIVQVDSPEGSRQDDYEEYRSWEDLEKIGMPASYYRERGFAFLILTDRNFKRIDPECSLVKEFTRGGRKIRIYKVPR